MFVCSSHNFIDSEVDDDCCQDETMEWDNNYNYNCYSLYYSDAS